MPCPVPYCPRPSMRPRSSPNPVVGDILHMMIDWFNLQPFSLPQILKGRPEGANPVIMCCVPLATSPIRGYPGAPTPGLP